MPCNVAGKKKCQRKRRRHAKGKRDEERDKMDKGRLAAVQQRPMFSVIRKGNSSSIRDVGRRSSRSYLRRLTGEPYLR